MRYIFIVLIILISTKEVFSCSPDANQMEEIIHEEIRLENEYAKKMFKRADEVFVGTVLEVKDGNSDYKQKAVISVEKTIKGVNTNIVEVFMAAKEHMETEEKELVFGCIRKPGMDEPYLVTSYKYIIYAKNGVLIREKGFPVGPNWPTANDEIELLKTANY